MKTLEWREDALWLLDQTKLPLEVECVECRNHLDVAAAIETMKVRGAPAIGLTAAYGLVLAARELAQSEPADFDAGFEDAAERLARTRPTAVNLFWAISRMRDLLAANREVPPAGIADLLLAEAHRMLRDDEAANRRMGAYGAEFVPDGANILTHCNAGALATGEYGTALGVIRAAHEQGKRIHVWVDETRPLLQGARLTAWELQEAGIPFTLITDNMAGHFMSRGEIDLAVVGADRIAANGDTANKIGTYSVAVLARAHDIPLYVAAPTSTVDLSIASGDHIPIEQRRSDEVTAFRDRQVAPTEARVANPAFDVTPSRLIAAIVTEQGVITDPFPAGLARAVGQSRDTANVVNCPPVGRAERQVSRG